jgi:hypothetical protein
MTDTTRDHPAPVDALVEVDQPEQDSFAKLTVQRFERITEITPHGVRYRYHSWWEEPTDRPEDRPALIRPEEFDRPR